MNTPNSEIKRWGIIVIQSLNHSDVKTGEIQYYDILQKGHGSSRAREFHPHPLTEPCVKVSPHTALHTQLFVHRHNLGV